MIYWHGYALSLKDSAAYRETDGMILLADQFPTEWVSPLDGKQQSDNSRVRQYDHDETSRISDSSDINYMNFF